MANILAIGALLIMVNAQQPTPDLPSDLLDTLSPSTQSEAGEIVLDEDDGMLVRFSSPAGL